MQRIECLIVDDEPNAVKLLEDYVHKIPQLELVCSCYDGAEAFSVLLSKQIDLVFMDINMPKINGMEIAGSLKPGQQLIFTTAYSEFALESYEHNAVDYLLKPISFQRFAKAIAKIRQPGSVASTPVTMRSHDADNYIFVKSDKKMLKIYFKDILFFEALKEYVCIHCKNHKMLAYKRMKDLAEKLPADFIRVHNSYIINSGFISKMEGNHLVINDVVIPISNSYKEAFVRFIQNKRL